MHMEDLHASDTERVPSEFLLSSNLASFFIGELMSLHCEDKVTPRVLVTVLVCTRFCLPTKRSS